MAKREKVYCCECKHYVERRGKVWEHCLVAETIVLPKTESYKHRADKRKKYCIEKNTKNNAGTTDLKLLVIDGAGINRLP